MRLLPLAALLPALAVPAFALTPAEIDAGAAKAKVGVRTVVRKLAGALAVPQSRPSHSLSSERPPTTAPLAHGSPVASPSAQDWGSPATSATYLRIVQTI